MAHQVKRILLILAAILTVGGASAAVAYASIPGPDGVIHGCYKPADGKLLVIDSAASCPSGDTALNWSQAGPQGPAGATGATGATGPAGADGVSGYQLETCNLGASDSNPLCSDTTNLGAGQLSGTLSCPSGKTAISGSWSQPAPSGTGVFGSAVPSAGSYQFTFETFGSAATSIHVYVTCILAS